MPTAGRPNSEMVPASTTIDDPVTPAAPLLNASGSAASLDVVENPMIVAGNKAKIADQFNGPEFRTHYGGKESSSFFVRRSYPRRGPFGSAAPVGFVSEGTRDGVVPV
jgi:hypothetical protein